MAPRSTTNKAKAAGIGASSFLDLKAELAGKEREIAENKATGKKTISGGQKPGKVSVSPSRSVLPSGRIMLMPFFFFALVGLARNQPYGADLTKASTREPRGTSSLKP